MNRFMRIISIFIILLLLSCGKSGDNSQQRSNIDVRKPMSWGHKQDIYVFADDNVWKYAEYHVRKSLERTVFTTMNEPYFMIKRAPLDKMESFYKFNNLLFLANLDSNQPVAQYVKNIMGESVSKHIEENSIGVYPQNNVWANDQFVLFLLADTERNLLELNLEMLNQTFDLFKERLFERISKQVFKNKIYDDSYFKTFNWKLDLPKTYTLYKHDAAENYVSFLARLRNKADRYITIYWEPMETDQVTDDWLKEKRADLAWKCYDEDEIFDKDIRFRLYELGSFAGWKMAGRWQNKKYSVGGAFQSFAFYDEESQTAFILDNSVYFPEGYKLAALIELEVISRTFEVKK
ncbi:MAG: DUF4837 family protein [Candidatus Cloacimonetes bacterium]|nr:DUF4837 family protein [Candidatus Cloacimonadota bacterium]MCF7814237.1 DUF4837 family protein [Candidatus Cloacimonadota bacterium]MCF7868444.1 DUF4837 family protein [Candidatus Cloacimonadota bacterium]MCF7883936.1 DUF4837 family protein [Candidatus Cloacimonadota bacterium]